MNRHLATATDCITLAALDAAVTRDSAAFQHCRDALAALDKLRVDMAAMERACLRALTELAGKTYASADDMGAHEALRAALARITNGA